MKDIKTKPGMPKPRILDKAARIPQAAKNTLARAKDRSLPQEDHYSPEQYATDKATQGAEKSVRSTFNHGRKGIKKTRDVIRRGRQAAREIKLAADAGRKGVKAAGKGIKTSAQAAKATAKASKVAADVARRAAATAVKAAKAAIQMMIKLVQLTVKAVIAAIKATIVAVKGLIAAIAAGGWVVLLIILAVGLIAFLILSPFGIFTGGGAQNTPTIPEVIQTINTEFTARIEKIKRDAGQVDQVSLSFDGSEDKAFIDNWPDILAVFAVKACMDSENPMDAVVQDEKRISMLRDVFWDMTSIEHNISEVSVESTPAPSPTPGSTVSTSPASSTSPAPTPAPKRILNIIVSSRYWEDMVKDYMFSEQQVQMLKELMSASNYSMLIALINSATGRPATDWSGVIDVPEGGMPIPLYLQGDYPETVCYIDGVAKSVKTSGCGAASVSMVIAYLTGNTSQTPYTLFKWAYDNGYYSGGGLGHSCLTKLAGLYGVKGTWIENDAEKIAAALRAGHPVIAHMGPGIFTDEGHYIVMRGITKDGYALVNDSGSRNRNRYAYELSTIVAQTRTFNSFMVCTMYLR